jgi:hypothetical protein
MVLTVLMALIFYVGGFLRGSSLLQFVVLLALFLLYDNLPKIGWSTWALANFPQPSFMTR